MSLLHNNAPFAATNSHAAGIEQQVKTIIVDKLGVEESQLQSGVSFTADLGIDSLDVFELIITLEDQFHLIIPSEEAEKLDTVGKLIDYIIVKAGMG